MQDSHSYLFFHAIFQKPRESLSNYVLRWKFPKHAQQMKVSHQASTFWGNSQQLIKQAINARCPTNLENSKQTKVAQIPKVPTTMSGMEVPQQLSVDTRFPNNSILFGEFQTIPTNPQQMQEFKTIFVNSQNFRNPQHFKISATMSGMEVPKRPSASARFQDNLEMFREFPKKTETPLEFHKNKKKSKSQQKSRKWRIMKCLRVS